MPEKCKLYNPNPTAWQDIHGRNIIPENLNHIQEGIFVNNLGERLRGVHDFNVPVGDADYVATVLQTKATQVRSTTRNYVKDLADDHPQELWTMLQYSIQHRLT